MTQQRIVVLLGQWLMLHGLLRWLTDQDGIETLGIDLRGSQTNEQIEDFCPDVIVLDEADVSTNGNVTNRGADGALP